MKKIIYLLILTLFLTSCGEKKEVLTEDTKTNSNTGVVVNNIQEVKKEEISTGSLKENTGAVEIQTKEDISTKSLKIEDNNVVLYENGKKVKDLTTDGNSNKPNDNTWKTCKAGEIFNYYNIDGKTNNFTLVSKGNAMCEGDGGVDILIFDNNKGSSLIYLNSLDLNNLGILSLGDINSLKLSILGEKLKISGDFQYNSKCDGRGCPTSVKKENIKEGNLKILKDSIGKSNDLSDYGKFELLLTYKDLFN